MSTHQVLEVHRALGDDQLRRTGRVLHQARLVQDLGHLGRVAHGAVHALHYGVDVVEAHAQVVGVSSDTWD